MADRHDWDFGQDKGLQRHRTSDKYSTFCETKHQFFVFVLSFYFISDFGGLPLNIENVVKTWSSVVGCTYQEGFSSIAGT